MRHAVFTDGILPGLNSIEREPFSFLKCNQKTYDKFIEHADGEDIIYNEQFKALVVLGRLVTVDDSIGDNEVRLYTEKPEPKPINHDLVSRAMTHVSIVAKPIRDCRVIIPRREGKASMTELLDKGLIL